MPKPKTISIRFNEGEIEELKYLKDIFGFSDTFGADSATIKTAITVCINVTQNIFGGKLQQMFRREAKQEKVMQKEKHREMP